jgi:hypothetical protein
MNDNKIWCASFDIGKKNFSFYVEEIDLSYLDTIEDVSYKLRYNNNGTSTDVFTSLLEHLFLDGKTILLENVDITSNCDKNLTLDPETFHNMTEVLDKYVSIWDKCSVFVIEKQMQFGLQINPMALKLGQHCYSYFSFKYGRFKDIIEYPAYNKTQVLGAEKTITKNGKFKSMDKTARKKWCVQKALHILSCRKDVDTFEKINDSKKKDDLSDVICQLASWKYLTFVKKNN